MCGGTIAQLYEDMVGRVFRNGKPLSPIYKDIIKQMKITKSSKVIVFGDSLWHDIAGGNEMGFDGLWIKNGVHKPQLNKKQEIQLLLNTYNPKYSIKELKL
jgi:ribonucleotide monophosphatase NagD (HAD superfamily)